MDVEGKASPSINVQPSVETESAIASLGPVVVEPALQSLTAGRVKAPGHRPSRDFRKSQIPTEFPLETENEEEEAKEKEARTGEGSKEKTSPPDTHPQHSPSVLQELSKAQTRRSLGHGLEEISQQGQSQEQAGDSKTKDVTNNQIGRMDAGPIFTQDVVQTEKEQEQEFSRIVEINLDDTDIQNIKRTDNVSGPQGAKNENPSHVSKSQIKCCLCLAFSQNCLS